MAYGALRRENRTPDDVIIRWSAAAADQHFKVLIVIDEPGSGVGGAHGGGAAWPHAVHHCSARHLGPRRCAEGSQRHPSERRRRTGRRLVLHRPSFGENQRDAPPAAGFSHRFRCGRRISNSFGGQGDDRQGGSGKGCGLGGLSISYPRALPAYDRRSRRSCAQWRWRWRRAFRRGRHLAHPDRLARHHWACTCARCFSATATIGAEGGLRPRRRALLSRAARRGVRPVRCRECAKARPRRVGSSASRIWYVMEPKRRSVPPPLRFSCRAPPERRDFRQPVCAAHENRQLCAGRLQEGACLAPAARPLQRSP